jgi:hypothetical protein
MSHPVAMQMVNWGAFFLQVFDDFDFKNRNELLVKGVIPEVNLRGLMALGGMKEQGQSDQGQGAMNDAMGAAEGLVTGGGGPGSVEPGNDQMKAIVDRMMTTQQYGEMTGGW